MGSDPEEEGIPSSELQLGSGSDDEKSALRFRLLSLSLGSPSSELEEEDESGGSDDTGSSLEPGSGSLELDERSGAELDRPNSSLGSIGDIVGMI